MSRDPMADTHHKRCPKDMDPMWGQCACDVIDGLLADLRAKVDDRAHRAAYIYREEGGTYWEGSMDAYGVVLSLIEEAGR